METKKINYIKIITIIIFFNVNLYSEDTLIANTSKPVIIINDFKDGFKELYNAGDYLVSDNRFYKNSIYGIGIFAVSQTLDIETLDLVKRNKNQTFKDISSVTNGIGDFLPTMGISGALYLSGLISSNDELRITARQFFESLLLSGIITYTFKYSFGRSRPYFNQDNLDFQFFETKEEYLSLPSGHTTASFALATIAANKIDTWWSYLAFYSLATITGLGRIYDNQHWFSDVAIGAFIGTISAKAILAVDTKNKNKNNSYCFFYSNNRIYFIYNL